MTVSEKQLAANQLNALKSTGPRTATGMSISSKNAIKHGLRSAEVVIPGEDPSEFDSFRQDLLDDLSPVGQLEVMLADRIVGAFWKLRRSGRMENELYMTLMNPDHSEKTIDKKEPYEFQLTCTNPDGSTYVEEHYSISDDGVKDLLKEPKPDVSKSPESVNTLRSLGSVVLQDFTSGNILTRFRRYEGQIERSLYKALMELNRHQFLRKRNDLVINRDES
jgi:hypothetical protein